jgi:hypothetical protein
MSFFWPEALLGAGESLGDWSEVRDAVFRYGSGVVSKGASARAKWNVIGGALTLWSPRGPGYGTAEVRLNGRTAATLDLHADRAVPSQPVWSAPALADGCHTVVVLGKSGRMPVDCLEVTGPR